MKKTFALIMALALTITCLVGCGSKDPALRLAAQRPRMPTSALWPMAI